MCIVITIISLNCMAIIGCRNRSYIAIIPACYKHGHIIHTGILHIRACYIYGRVTYTACYIYGNVTYTACYIYGMLHIRECYIQGMLHIRECYIYIRLCNNQS